MAEAIAPREALVSLPSRIAIVELVDLEVQRRAILNMHDVLAESAEDSPPSGDEQV